MKHDELEELVRNEAAVIGEALRERVADNRLDKTSVAAHLNLASIPTREALLKIHDVLIHGNANIRAPFEKKIDPEEFLSEIRDDIKTIHQKFEDEQALAGVHEKMGSKTQLRKINDRENSKPASIKDLLYAASMIEEEIQ
jgi:hypothetical protein